MSLYDKGVFQHVHETSRRADSAVHIAGIWQEHGELVTAKPSDGIRLPERTMQSGPHLPQERVSPVVTKGVVNVPKPIKIKEQERQRFFIPPRMQNRLLQTLAK
jgi:hypothetical protein